jgi:UDP-3-O-[3-hydroxymyristoyl] glucosamine N-acyltransferase
VVKTLEELAQLLGGEFQGPPDLTIGGIAAIDQAGPEEITFITRAEYGRKVETSRAGAFLVSPQWRHLQRPLIITSDPYLAYARVATLFAPPLERWPGISNRAYLGRNPHLGEDVSIAPFVWVGDEVCLEDRVTLMPGTVIGNKVSIGADTLIYPNVTIRNGCTVGKGVIIHSGAVIGSDGFGFAPQGGNNVKIPQLGVVTIEDDVEIGANCCIDRGALGETRICQGVKIDNLVQIAHNVVIGKNAIVVAQVGISGSTHIGNNAIIGGQAGLGGHIKIGDRVRIGAQAGVTNSVAPDQTVTGYPAIPHRHWLRAMAVIPKLPELMKKINKLEKKIERLTAALPKESPS